MRNVVKNPANESLNYILIMEIANLLSKKLVYSFFKSHPIKFLIFNS